VYLVSLNKETRGHRETYAGRKPPKCKLGYFNKPTNTEECQQTTDVGERPGIDPPHRLRRKAAHNEI
jgi:hypothetical protein